MLLSGGMDSATTLALAGERGFSCYALSFRYGQRHEDELACARRQAERQAVAAHRVVDLDVGFVGGSALTDRAIDVPLDRDPGEDSIPITYVPARNTLFLAVALGWAEVLGADRLFIGVNAVDYSGYPDCRPAFLEAFEAMANLATRRGVEGHRLRVEAPLLHWSKGRIVREATRLGVDLGATLSCYAPAARGRPCGRCDACNLRARGFAEAGLSDPAGPVS